MIRKLLHAAGFRYLLHVKNLPGKPDLVFPRYWAVIFVNGCFWHGHDCHLFRWPGTRPEFWRAKIGGNIARDLRARGQLAEAGWRVADIWECTLKGREKLPQEEMLARCTRFLMGNELYVSIGAPSTVPCPEAP